MRRASCVFCWFTVALPFASGAPFGEPYQGQPGDAILSQYLAQETSKIESARPEEAKDFEILLHDRDRLKREYFYMLGLWPLPEKTPLHPTITGSLAHDGFVVDKLHFQSRPRLYVTGNLYRPAKRDPGKRLPAVLVVCGHSDQGPNGNKDAYQFLGIWFASHGYIALVIDTLQLGEVKGIHHGTYMENRWWWHSRGYTSAGVECWNGIRAIDYLQSRDDVDPERIAVTGISGGGAATLWISAADDRVTACVPVSGMADLQAYVTNQFVDGHCDCMLMYNTYLWPWHRIAALIAPRPMLFANSDADPIFPMDSNERIINNLERAYSMFGASDFVDCLISRGGHEYRKDLRQGTYRFINTHLKNDSAVVLDSEVDLVVRHGKTRVGAIPGEKLRVFATAAEYPKDQLNSQIDQRFVPMATVEPPKQGMFESWKQTLLDALRQTTFRTLPERIPPAKRLGVHGKNSVWLASEEGIRIVLRRTSGPDPASAKRILMLVATEEDGQLADKLQSIAKDGDAVFVCEPRGVRDTRWTKKSPPNYFERSLALLGRTADTGRMWDIIAAARYLKAEHGRPIVVAGHGDRATLAAYAALWEPEIEEVVLVNPALTHMQATAPQFLSILRTCDIPETLGMLAPRSLHVIGGPKDKVQRVQAIYAAADAGSALKISAED